MVHPIPNCWRGDCNYGARWPLWGNLEVTIIHHDIADSNTWPVNTVWWIACACRHTHKCACRFGVRARCMCACVRPPGEPLWPDGVSDGTLITQPSKGGCPGQKWVEGWWLCGGWRCCLWGEGVESEGHMWRSACLPSDHADMQPLTQVSDQMKHIVRGSLCHFLYIVQLYHWCSQQEMASF